MSDTTRTEPIIRVRLQYTSTIKDGWRLGEATVEYTCGNDGVIDWDRIKAESTQAFEIGNSEAARQNGLAS